MDVKDSGYRLELKKWIRREFDMATRTQDSNDEVCSRTQAGLGGIVTHKLYNY